MTPKDTSVKIPYAILGTVVVVGVGVTGRCWMSDKLCCPHELARTCISAGREIFSCGDDYARDIGRLLFATAAHESDGFRATRQYVFGNDMIRQGQSKTVKFDSTDGTFMVGGWPNLSSGARLSYSIPKLGGLSLNYSPVGKDPLDFGMGHSRTYGNLYFRLGKWHSTYFQFNNEWVFE